MSPTRTSSRRRNGTTAGSRSRVKQKQYIIESSSSEEEEGESYDSGNENNESCTVSKSVVSSKKNQRGAKSSSFRSMSGSGGGVLASLNNQLPKHRKKLTSSARKKKNAKGQSPFRKTAVVGLDDDDSADEEVEEEEVSHDIKLPTPTRSRKKKSDVETSRNETKQSALFNTPEPKGRPGRKDRSNQTDKEQKSNKRTEAEDTTSSKLSMMTPPPTSVIVKHGRKTLDDIEMSPPTSENRRKAGRSRLQVQRQQQKKGCGGNKRRPKEEEEISAMSSSQMSGSFSSSSEEEEEDDDDSSSDDESSRASNDEASSENESDASSSIEEEDEEDGQDDDMEDEESDMRDEESDEEFEFEDDEFVPEEEEGYGDDDSDGSLGDFIVEETPRKSARLSARKAKKTNTGKSIEKDEDSNVLKKEKCQDNEENYGLPSTDDCSPIQNSSPMESDSVIEENNDEDNSALPPIYDCSPIQKDIPRESNDSIVEKDNVGSNCDEAKDGASIVQAGTVDADETIIEDTPMKDLKASSDVDETLLEETPMENSNSSRNLVGVDENFIEESPMKTSLPRRALNFQSPEPEVVEAEVIEDDEDDMSDDVECVAVIVDEDEEEVEIDQAEKSTDERPEVNDESLSSFVQEDTIDEELDSLLATEKENDGLLVADEKQAEDEPKVDQKQKDDISNNAKSNLDTNCSDGLRERWLNLQIASPHTHCSEESADVEGTPTVVSSKIDDRPREVNEKPKSVIKDIAEKEVTRPKIDKSYRAEGSVKRGQWTLGAKIGKGSFGEVFVGMNTKKGTLMAVKKFFMEGSVKADISTEIELLRSLKHDNIVRYLGAEMDSKTLHIFQEWVPGGSVSSLLAKFGPFSLEVIQSYISQTLTGLAYLHQNHIMHRDIKGSNVLVNDYGVVKLADFGASKKLANLEDNLLMSMTVRGSPYFMAPEVFEEKYSAKADVWSIGGLAFQMTTGMPPWKEKGFTNPISLYNHIKRQTGPPRMEHPGSPSFTSRQKTMWHMLEDLVRKCFDHDCESRPNVKQVQDDPFFLSIHECDDDETQCLGLFSPRNGGLALASPLSPKMRSPTPPSIEAPRCDKKTSLTAGSCRSPAVNTPLARSKSVVQWKTTFASPPRQRRQSNTKSTPSPVRKTPGRHSPSPNTSEWPEWAKNQLKKYQDQKLPMQTPHKEMQDLQTLMDSLAVSESTTSFQVQNFANKTSVSTPTTVSSSSLNKSSPLIGLTLLEETDADQNSSRNKAKFEI
mmetsp:Transcript_45559/g.110874  ORF Transcript_45559/g.110874 Transcript_45559/m.110874 type:complete len:1247 (-) Transcript_45559:103-3843(-)